LIKNSHRLGKNFRKPYGGIFLTHTVGTCSLRRLFGSRSTRCWSHECRQTNEPSRTSRIGLRIVS